MLNLYDGKHHRRDQQEVYILILPVGSFIFLNFSLIANYYMLRHARFSRDKLLLSNDKWHLYIQATLTFDSKIYAWFNVRFNNV